jgi:hypothetical protein
LKGSLTWAEKLGLSVPQVVVRIVRVSAVVVAEVEAAVTMAAVDAVVVAVEVAAVAAAVADRKLPKGFGIAK